MLSTSVSSGRGIGFPYVSLGVPNSASCLFLLCSAQVSLANPESRISFSLRRSSFSLKSVPHLGFCSFSYILHLVVVPTG